MAVTLANILETSMLGEPINLMMCEFKFCRSQELCLLKVCPNNLQFFSCKNAAHFYSKLWSCQPKNYFNSTKSLCTFLRCTGILMYRCKPKLIEQCTQEQQGFEVLLTDIIFYQISQKKMQILNKTAHFDVVIHHSLKNI